MTSPPPGGARWVRLRELFDAALPLPAADREALLADPALSADLVAELRSLLAHAGEVAQADAAGAGFLGQPAAPGLAGALEATASDAGRVLGPWRLVSPLGAGGMGEVWRAERADGRFQGAAAVKLLKRGMDSAAVLARFAQEQQVLARLSHPHIARLFDAGLSADGRPYFVMELVDGQPIDRACEGLALEARLQLFLQLADAVAHAHRNLLVHRDLKPGNVLVDGQGQVKLLDFGIAKALDPLEGSDATQTAAGERPFTPHYASPEQVRGEPVSTATDLYSLGVLLYVMLTGQRPYGRGAASALDAARAVLEEEPTRPSSVATPAPGWEATRRRLQGDLDNILLTALQKPIERRYASVDALAADVRAYLGGFPVSARAAAPAYVLAKFVRRHRWAVLAGGLGGLGLASGLAAALLSERTALGLGVLGLAGGLVAALLQARQAALARDAASQSRDQARHHLVEVRRLANTLVFEVNDALERGVTEGRRQLVHAAAQSLERQAAFGPLGDEERIELGQALARLARIEGHEHTDNLGDVPAALQRYRQALALLAPLAPRQDGQVAWHAAMVSALEGQASVLRSLKQMPEAHRSMESVAHHAARAVALQPDELRWRFFECAAQLELTEYDYPPVRWLGLQRLDGLRDGVPRLLALTEALVARAPEHPRAWRLHASALLQRSGLQAIEGRQVEAIDDGREALALVERLARLPGGGPVRDALFAAVSLRVALTLRAAGRVAEALDVTRPALAEGVRALQADPSSEYAQHCFIAPIQTAMDLHLMAGEPAPALALYRQALERLDGLRATGARTKMWWQYAWIDSLAVLAALDAGQAAEAQAPADRIAAWLADDSLRLRTQPGPLDCELETQIHTALAVRAAAQGHDAAAAASADAALERLQAMRALRDPGDAIERIRAGQHRQRLAQALARHGGPGLQALALRLQQEAGSPA